MKPRFSIGETVYQSQTVTEMKKFPCPDCFGKTTWHVRSPAGEVYTAPCPRCQVNYQSNDCLRLDYRAHAPIVTRLTIGSIQTDTAASSQDQVRYMCAETGIGSGSVYRELDLHASEDEALAAAKLLAAERNETPGHLLDVYNRTLKFSDYLLRPAVAADEKARNSRLQWEIRDIKEAVRGCDNMKEIAELLSEWDSA